MIIQDEARLRYKCKQVSLIEALRIIKTLEEELNNAGGVGLAAPQIGIDAAVCIIKTENIIAFINPIITVQDDLRLFSGEGCLSFPNKILTTKRFNEIIVKDDSHINPMIFAGYDAVKIQHECQHLEGKLFFDYAVKIPKHNETCFCGSGKKFKRCCLGREIK